MIGVSDNESCHELVKLLRDKLGDEYFQAYCGEAGLSNTSIKRSSPEDIAFLLENLYKGELFQNQDISRKCVDMLKQQIHNDRIPYCLPARIKKNIAHKTGTDYINENYKGLKIVCHDAGIIYTPKGDFIICVMIEYKVDDGKILKPSTPTAWRWAYTENKMYLLITKGNEIIRRIAMTIYYDCIERRTKPQPVL
jgi:beta-lactamase class A